MEDACRLAIEGACTRLIYEFARFNDYHEHEKLAALFAEDCVFTRPLDPTHPYYGRDAVHRIFRDRPRMMTRHVMTNVVIDVLSETEARGSSYITMISGANPEGPTEGNGIFFGGFDDEFVKIADGWKFKSRIGNLAAYQGGQPPVLPVPSDEERGLK